MEMPDKVNIIRTTERGGFWDVEYIQTAYPEHEGIYHHDRILKAKDAEIEKLKDALHKEQNRLFPSWVKESVLLKKRIAELEAILQARGE